MSDIITFYSYKGGVGRTMALANVSVMLAKWGHKVLVVDWDLEAPGLEHFYQNYIDTSVTSNLPGVVDLLEFENMACWKDGVVEVNIKEFSVTIHLISSGRRDDNYFKKVRNFNVDVFYENGGGDIIERLREEWLAEYDYVLIDSRTGITEIGGICTIQLPNTVVMLFTATKQGFEGTLDIIKRAAAAQQKLPYDRQKLIFLPIPSKFDSTPEFELSQRWLGIFAEQLEPTYYDWLPGEVNRKDFLERTKIPYLPYFSFGEKLPVIEQGVKDPAGLGYAYETLAALIANHLRNADILNSNRDLFISQVDQFYSEPTEAIKNGSNGDLERRLRRLKQQLQVSDERVIIKKDKDVVLNYLASDIVPALETISREMVQFGSMFKIFSETLKINIKDKYIENNIIAFQIAKINSQLPSLTAADVRSIEAVEYLLSFENLMRIKGNVKIDLTLSFPFHTTSVEIFSPQAEINLSKLYHQDITPVDTQKIVELMSDYVLREVEKAIN